MEKNLSETRYCCLRRIAVQPMRPFIVHCQAVLQMVSQASRWLIWLAPKQDQQPHVRLELLLDKHTCTSSSSQFLIVNFASAGRINTCVLIN